MITRQRVDLVARAHPTLFARAELLRLLRTQLGHVDALDGWILREGIRVRARAPKIIYHICAGNLAVSACMSIAQGFLLGAFNVVKLPGDRDDSGTRREILKFIRGLPSPLRAMVTPHRELDLDILKRAEAVIAFGSDETMARLRAQTRWDQKFIGHGHALSLLWLAEPNALTARQARACAVDVLTYDQLGCLSPQAIYVPRGTDISVLGRKLTQALEAYWRGLKRRPSRPLAVAARIAEARDMAHALGHDLWLPPGKHLGWTLIYDPERTFQPSPLHGVIAIREADEAQIGAALASVAGRISTVGMVGEMSSSLENVFLSLGVSRFCAAGRMQFPPLTWHHDGRSSLGDLVTWIDAEGLE
jgi:hypothetical protein